MYSRSPFNPIIGQYAYQYWAEFRPMVDMSGDAILNSQDESIAFTAVMDFVPILTATTATVDGETSNYPNFETIIVDWWYGTIVPGSLQLNATIGEEPVQVLDNALGILYAGNTRVGTINYAEQTIAIEFPGPPTAVEVIFSFESHTNCSIHRMTSTDGFKWTDQGPCITSNPTPGGDFIGHHRACIGPSGTWYIFYTDNAYPDVWYYATSIDEGVTWSAPTEITIPSVTLPTGYDSWGPELGNPWPYWTGTSWLIFLERVIRRTGGGTSWHMALLTGPDFENLTGTADLPGLQFGTITPPATVSIGANGGPCVWQDDNDLYHMLFHHCDYGDLPSTIWESTSVDLITWTTPTSVITFTENQDVYGADAINQDQVADPSRMVFNNQTFLYFTAVNNGLSLSNINVAIVPETASVAIWRGIQTGGAL